MNERLPWHKPAIQQLTITLDTAADVGSGIDGGFAEPAIPI
jgi:hypothetical protein